MKRILSDICPHKSYHFETLKNYYFTRTSSTSVYEYLHNGNFYNISVVTFKKLWREDSFLVHPKHKRLLINNRDNLEVILNYLESKK